MSPEELGSPIEIEFLPNLRARSGKLRSGKREPGKEVHAGSFLRERRIVLDSSLRKRPRELRRILTHELFHFAWVRLGNGRRREWETLLRREIQGGVRGELGWSAELIKAAMTRADRVGRSRRWREYVCESFCDSAAWLFTAYGPHDEFTLPASARRARRECFGRLRLDREISV
jgi:hypothetical protein